MGASLYKTQRVSGGLKTVIGKRILLGLVLTGAMLVGATACTPQQLEALQALQGNIKNIDAVSGNVTVLMKDGTISTFNFDKVPASTIRQALGAAIFERGDEITIKRDGEGKIRGIECRKAEVEGKITAIGTANVTIKTDRGPEVTLKWTSANTTITIEDKAGSAAFTDLKVGQEVDATYDVSTMIALKVEVQAADEVDVRGGLLEGTIKSITADNKTIVVTGVRKGDVTVNIADNTTITVAGKGTITAAGLKKGQMVRVTYASTAGVNTAIKVFVVAGGRSWEDWNPKSNGRGNAWDNNKGNDNKNENNGNNNNKHD
jgi:hypothetical protein